jgi:DUF2075 family protein
MIVYKESKRTFIDEVTYGQIDDDIEAAFVREVGHYTSKAEKNSWRNSMQYMYKVVNDPAIPDDATIIIEYRLPLSAKRIDFMIAGVNEQGIDSAVIVELKQWESAEKTDMDGIVKAFVGKRVRELSHPSYQAWSYAQYLEDFNEAVREDNILLHPCAFLHNCDTATTLQDSFYDEYTQQAPVFLKNDVREIQDYIKQYIKHGDKNDVIQKIENGRISPSKQLADSLSSMLKGNREFTLLDEQKLVYETALRLSRESTKDRKRVFIVEGGPGTGKSVVAINLLVKLIKKERSARYVTKNGAPRAVYQMKLRGDKMKRDISSLFVSSDNFREAETSEFDMLIVDEAHRLREKGGLFGNLGENQVKELINAAKCTIFFIDEDQRVTLSDIGQKSEIHKWAQSMGAEVTEMELASQFRCNGSDGYLAWLDNILDIRETANVSIDDIEYDFQVIDSPERLKELIVAKNGNNKSRMVAGYCWKWPSAKDPSAYDIEIGDFKARWNLKNDGQAWIIKPNSINEVGCIHTCQGLELDYVGVIIGPDLVVRNGKIITDATKRASSDTSVRGYRRMLKEDPENAQALGDMIIKNTYRTLMTRGMQGCYIYSTDQETQEWFQGLTS